MGDAHTHFDDVESFLYVLLLFFFSYAGPLPKADLESAHERGFVRPIESGCLPHVRHWPQQFIDWADGSAGTVGRSKSCHISSPHCVKFLLQDDEVGKCFKHNWPEDLQSPIRSLLENSFKAFRKSMQGGTTPEGRTELSHDKFVQVLDDWLEEYSGFEDEYSNCPGFENSRLGLRP